MIHDAAFRDSSSYWERRYASGGNSGQGSYDFAAHWKAETVNALVRDYQILSVIEFGCGDGSQLALGKYPTYIGTDISPSAIRRCIDRYSADKTKSFWMLDPRFTADPLRALHADMALSMDVIFHLVEDDVREAYLRTLFGAADRLVVIYSSDGPVRGPAGAHERHRPFTPLIRERYPEWQLVSEIRSKDQADRLERGIEDEGAVHFFVFGRSGATEQPQTESASRNG